MDKKYCHANKPQYREWIKNKNCQPEHHPDNIQYVFHGSIITQKMLGISFKIIIFCYSLVKVKYAYIELNCLRSANIHFHDIVRVYLRLFQKQK